MKPGNSPRSVRFYRLLLRLYPSEFREEFGDEMVLCFRDSLRSVSGATGLLRVWLDTAIDLLSSVVRENCQALHRIMNPKKLPSSRPFRFVVNFPFGSVFALVALVMIVWLGFQLRTKDFSPPAYFLVMIQATVLSLIILISGFIVDLGQHCLRLLRREVMVSTLIVSTLGIALMGVGIYRLQYLELTVEQMLPLVLQIAICGTIWIQIVMLHEVRSAYRAVCSHANSATGAG